MNSKNVDQLENGTTTNNIPGAQYFTKSNAKTHSENLSNSINIRTEYAIDSLTTIILNASGALTNKVTNSETNTEANDETGSSINSSTRNNYNETEGQNGRISLTFRKKFKKEGRSFSANINGSLRFSENNGTLNSNNYIKFNNSNIAYNQNKYNTSETNQYGFRVTYSEPLIKNTF